jgi:hypothetical protein
LLFFQRSILEIALSLVLRFSGAKALARRREELLSEVRDKQEAAATLQALHNTSLHPPFRRFSLPDSRPRSNTPKRERRIRRSRALQVSTRKSKGKGESSWAPGLQSSLSTTTRERVNEGREKRPNKNEEREKGVERKAKR